MLAVLVAIYGSLRDGVFTLEELNIDTAAAMTLLLAATGQTIVLLRGGPAVAFLLTNCLAGACLGFQFALAGGGILRELWRGIDGTTVECSSIKIGSDNNTEPVPTMNRENRSKGYKRGVQKYTISADVPVPEGDLAVDFDEKYEEGALFEIIAELEGGAIDTYLDCKLAKVDRDSKEGDSTSYSLEIGALDRVRS